MFGMKKCLIIALLRLIVSAVDPVPYSFRLIETFETKFVAFL